MRRKDREVTDNASIGKLIDACYCCRLGFNDNGRVYIVPLSFGYEEIDGKRVFYFHGAAEGRKIDLIKQTRHAGFELDTGFALHESETSCGYSAAYQSVIGTGRVSIIADSAEKAHALRRIMEHNAGMQDWRFPEAMLAKTAVIKLEVEELSCKAHA